MPSIRNVTRLARLSVSFVTGLVLLVAAVGVAEAQTKIVAFGTSFTRGKGVSSAESYPAQLQAMLRAKGLSVTIQNAGVDGDTAVGGLARLDSSVPQGTQIAISSSASTNCAMPARAGQYRPPKRPNSFPRSAP